jgi:large repetitive protein
MSDPVFVGAFTNLYGLTSVGSYSKPTLVDIDGDGDLDAFVGEKYGKTLFFKNTGSPTNPIFAAAAINPSGLIDVGSNSKPTFVDIDGDGDLDAFIGEIFGNTLFFKNTGSPTNLLFAAATNNPFGLIDVGSFNNPTFVDIDGDGDLDAFIGNGIGNTLFFKNTGSPTNPLFAAATNNPFGLIDVGSFNSPNFVDIDSDGDLDAFFGNSAGNTLFFRNTSTTITPEFAAATTDPFGLADVGGWSTPNFVDIDGDGDLDAFIGEFNGNTLFFSNNKPPEISRARYDLTTGSLIVTGTGFLLKAGANNDIDVSKLTIAGQGGATYTLTSANVDITSATSFSITLNAADKAVISKIVDKKGNQSSGATIYNLAAAEDWAAGAAAAVIVADLTGNGITAVADPIFETPTTNPFGLTNVGYRGFPAFVDIDGDGDLDALVGNSDGNTLFFKNMGSPTNPLFAAATTNPFGLADVGNVSAPTFVDIDGDSDLDAFVGNSYGNILFFKNIGISTPVFAAPITNYNGLTNLSGSGYAAPSFADLDGDGDLDALVGNQAGDLLFFKNTGTINIPVFATAVTNPFGLKNLGNFSTPTIVDLDGDGKLDVVTSSVGLVRFFRNTGTTTTPSFSATSNIPSLNVVAYASPSLIDIDGDGNLDAGVVDTLGNVRFYRNALQSVRNDFNGDKKSDILWRKNDGTVALWQMNGSTVTTGSYVTPTLDSTWKIASTADFSGDGKADILWRNDNGTNALWTMNGSTIVGGGYIPTLDSTWKVAGTADFDGDKKADLLWRKDDGTTALWKMDGATVVSGGYLPTLDSTWKVASSGDFDGDAKADILWRNDDGTTALWKMNGSTIVSGSYVTPSLDSTWKVASSADFNGDGKTDLLWRKNDGTTALWTMNGSAITAGGYLPTLDSTWKVASSGDFNGDGKADILWRNDNGTNALWEMNGATVLAGSYTPTLDSSWQVAAPIL